MANIFFSTVIILALAILLLPACSGDGGGGGSVADDEFSTTLAAYEQAISDKAKTLADSLGAVYVDKIGAGEADPVPAVLDQLEGEVAEFNDFLCQRLQTLSNAAGSGDSKQKRMSEAGAVSEQIVRDAVIAALLNRALAAPPEQRDQLLDLLGVEAIGPDGSELKGTAALQDAGLMGAEDSVTIPERGSSKYTQYLDWFGHEARGLSGPDVIKRINDRIRECTSET